MAALLAWVATLPVLVQILVVVGGFLAGTALAILIIDVAPRPGRTGMLVRLAACVLVPLGVLLFVGSYTWAAFVAAALGVGVFFLDARARGGRGTLVQLLTFLGPALVLVIAGLVIPAIQTTGQAFFSANGNRFVGLDNFLWIFTRPEGLRVVGNTIVWVVITPVVATIAGLAYAIFIDRSRGEKVLKSLLFMPMAISFVGASIIWKFMYTARPAGQEQIGLLNQIIVWFGGQPVDVLQQQPWNTLFLIVVLIWVQTGFAVVVLSASIKGVPAELLEAAELDGAGAWQRFRSVTLPSIRPALIVVLTTISIASFKVFDIVRTMTAGANGTSVIANEMYTQFRNFEQGQAAALALVLFVLVIPVIIYNARQMRRQGVSR